MNLENPPATSSETTPRALTKFICQELLYEFVTGRLDTDRQAEVDDFVQANRECQRELEKLKRGLKFTALASRTEVSEDLREALVNFEPLWKKTLTSWTIQFTHRGWRVLPYVLLLGALGLSMVVFKPWQRINNREIIMVEEHKTEPIYTPPPADAEVQTAPTPQPLVMLPQPEAKPEAKPEAQLEVNETASEPPVFKGKVLRATLTVDHFAIIWPEIRDKVVALGGEGFNGSQLGTLHGEEESRFDISLPESNKAELEEYLKSFGLVRFRQDRRPQEMPDGQIRIILSIKDGSPNEGPAETP